MGFLDKLIAPVATIVGKFVKDKDLAAQLQAQLNVEILGLVGKELDAQKSIILAEANGSWLQRSWRPLMMVFFAGLIGAHWFGFTPENLTNEQIADLYDLVKIGIGGYVVGRTVEKVVPSIVAAKK
jgi:Holin of 3TMs, for gene-transfer release